ncbi:unnamed protein product [Medioppia subpectinata]|uniref:KxDL domain-containing protein n=1 Tax=Medioppia subpectinata TaxID=1979941 RepID=A0A7R9LH31_9ACAR|nr:unnamed protein product [Medioppia subpectinata]CAG2118788.1 unnamed protein product [Medioppia subpectinata]
MRSTLYPIKGMASGVEECTESESVSTVMCRLVDSQHVDAVLDSQTNMLSMYEKSNEMLVNCNALAVHRFTHTSVAVQRYVQQLTDLRKDLDSVYHRIKFMKLKLSQQYSHAFKGVSLSITIDVSCGNVCNRLDEEEETADDIKNVKIRDE